MARPATHGDLVKLRADITAVIRTFALQVDRRFDLVEKKVEDLTDEVRQRSSVLLRAVEGAVVRSERANRGLKLLEDRVDKIDGRLKALEKKV